MTTAQQQLRRVGKSLFVRELYARAYDSFVLRAVAVTCATGKDPETCTCSIYNVDMDGRGKKKPN